MGRVPWHEATNLGGTALSKLKAASDRISLKLKGTAVERWAEWWRHLGRDYLEMFAGVRQECRDRPIRAAIWASALAAAGVCARLNPDERSWRAACVTAANEVALIAPGGVRPEAVAHLRHAERCVNRDLVRRLNLGIASVLWADRHPNGSGTAEATCAHLQVPWRERPPRLLDVGFLGVWWLTARNMLDYDVNY